MKIISVVIETDLTEGEVKNKIELALEDHGSVRLIMEAAGSPA